MSRTKGALGKKNRLNINPILPGLIEKKQAIEKQFIKQENNQCNFKLLCELNKIDPGYNDTCFNPAYCLNNFNGKCSLIIPRPIQVKAQAVQAKAIQSISIDNKPIKRGRGRPKKEN
jgi:hypothetical protein